MPKRKPKADVIQFPPGGRDSKSIDVRKLLLEDQSEPTVPIPAELQEAIDKRALELSKEAYALCREHLLRRAAFFAEFDMPRRLDLDRAYEVIAQGDLGHALAHAWRTEMRHIARYAGSAAFASARFEEKMRAAMQGFAEDD
jgi:hypothetical protein